MPGWSGLFSSNDNFSKVFALCAGARLGRCMVCLCAGVQGQHWLPAAGLLVMHPFVTSTVLCSEFYTVAHAGGGGTWRRGWAAGRAPTTRWASCPKPYSLNPRTRRRWRDLAGRLGGGEGAGHALGELLQDVGGLLAGGDAEAQARAHALWCRMQGPSQLGVGELLWGRGKVLVG